ncbi:MAG: hypothetical protein KC422_02225 [Trueperaceae bacterium]|nr:hypothetical protein [Trueperaceae bacterium]
MTDRFENLLNAQRNGQAIEVVTWLATEHDKIEESLQVVEKVQDLLCVQLSNLEITINKGIDLIKTSNNEDYVNVKSEYPELANILAGWDVNDIGSLSSGLNTLVALLTECDYKRLAKLINKQLKLVLQTLKQLKAAVNEISTLQKLGSLVATRILQATNGLKVFKREVLLQQQWLVSRLLLISFIRRKVREKSLEDAIPYNLALSRIPTVKPNSPAYL